MAPIAYAHAVRLLISLIRHAFGTEQQPQNATLARRMKQGFLQGMGTQRFHARKCPRYLALATQMREEIDPDVFRICRAVRKALNRGRDRSY